MKQVIENFINMLSTRIEFLNAMDEKLDSSKALAIESIINKYGSIDSQKFNADEMNIVADVLRIDKNDGVLSNYQVIDMLLQDYMDGYAEVKDTHEENSNNEISIYRKYIDLLSNDQSELFVDFDELDNLMFELGVPITDKWKIISYLDNRNVTNNGTNILAINLNSKLVLYNKLYLSDDRLKDLIYEYIKNKDIDLSMIPGIVNKLSDNTYNKETVQNALSTLILNELYLQLLESSEDNYDNLQEMVEMANSYITSYEDTIINPSRNIISTYSDVLNEELNKGNDVNEYMNISIYDINNLVQDKDKALTLKRLPIIKRIKETLDNMSNCDKTSDEYIDCLKLLSNLYEAYEETLEV